MQFIGIRPEVLTPPTLRPNPSHLVLVTSGGLTSQRPRSPPARQLSARGTV
jgi:hypothetical protein